MSDHEIDPFREEADMQAWASELGHEYTVGSQGALGQPIREMSDARLDSTIGQVSEHMRELSGLPSLPDERERSLHRTRSELDAMTDDELMRWQGETLEWLIDNPTATIDNLIKEDPRSNP